jgi:hypothetical protein
MYRAFREKQDQCIKVVMNPGVDRERGDGATSKQT